jgi:hypothetical protein
MYTKQQPSGRSPAGVDRAGAISSNVSKHRMEFYPNELEPGIEDRIWQDKVLG